MVNSTPQDQMRINPSFTYLNHASIGPLPSKSFEKIQEGFTLQMEEGEKKIDYPSIEEIWGKLLVNGGRLVGGDREGIAITSNTASGLHIIAEGLSNKYVKGSNIVIPDNEFVTNSYTWQQIAKKYHIELRTLDTTNGYVTLETWEKNIDANTVLVSLSHVQGGNGYRYNLNEITDIAHSKGAFVVVDVIQSLGVIPFDAKKYDIDFVAAGAYKWMLGPLGKGLFYTKPEHVETLESILVGWFSTPNFQELYHQPFIPWSDARKFQQSMIDPTLNGFNESLETILKWDINETQTHVISLQDYLIDLIFEMDGFSIASSTESNERSGIIKIDHKDAKSIVQNLGALEITVSFRADGIRVSPHRHNTKTDIEKLVKGI